MFLTLQSLQCRVLLGVTPHKGMQPALHLPDNARIYWIAAWVLLCLMSLIRANPDCMAYMKMIRFPLMQRLEGTISIYWIAKAFS